MISWCNLKKTETIIDWLVPKINHKVIISYFPMSDGRAWKKIYMENNEIVTFELIQVRESSASAGLEYLLVQRPSFPGQCSTSWATKYTNHLAYNLSESIYPLVL